MITKKYRLTTAIKANVTICINGRPFVVLFENGTFGEHRTGGYFLTTDENVQLALEADPRFNSVYRLESEKESPDKPKKENAPKASEMPNGGIFTGVTNSQQAKKKLMEVFPDLTHAKLPNKEAIVAFAASHEITFPDWTI